MAKEEHIKILNRGVDAWNQWRIKHPEIAPDLSEALLVGAYLIGADLHRTDLGGAKLDTADLSHANLREAYLRNAELNGAFLIKAELSNADLRNVSLRNGNLKDAKLKNTNLSEANLTEANMIEAKLIEANLTSARLRGAVCRKADFRKAKLNDASLDKAIFCGADFSEANLRGAYLNHTNLNVAKLDNANLDSASLVKANLKGAYLQGTDLSATNLGGADITGAQIGWAKFGNNDLSAIKGLDRVLHRGPSTIGIDTIYRSGGKIPEVFLRGCGVPDGLITFLPSIIGAQQAIQFYSCFISYSHKDEEFARRLHSHLRNSHVRVWFAPEDIKSGEKLYEQIDSAIRYYDKLLIVLSEHSLHSEWVMTEIRRARKAEFESKRRKLFPVRLTSFKKIQEWECFDADSGKDLAVEVREYFIPDFSSWRKPDAFEATFNRLMKDLRPVESSSK